MRKVSKPFIGSGTRVIDTSVLVAGIIEDHEFHTIARPLVFAAAAGRIPGIVLAETWSALRRAPWNLEAATVEQALQPDCHWQPSIAARQPSHVKYPALPSPCCCPTNQTPQIHPERLAPLLHPYSFVPHSLFPAIFTP